MKITTPPPFTRAQVRAATSALVPDEVTIRSVAMFAAGDVVVTAHGDRPSHVDDVWHALDLDPDKWSPWIDVKPDEVTLRTSDGRFVGVPVVVPDATDPA